MDSKEASTIINEYWATIKDERPKNIFLSTNLLPCTVARLKYAHFVFGETLVINGEITKDVTKVSMESYGMIDSIFREDPEPHNTEYHKYIEGLRNGTITDFRHPNPFGEPAAVTEYYNFIGECIFKFKHEQVEQEDLFGAFVYEALLDKVILEKDVKKLIEITNTSLTRLVMFPNKKKNDECVFL